MLLSVSLGQSTLPAYCPNPLSFTALVFIFTLVCASGWQEHENKCFYFSGKDTVKSFLLGESKCKALNSTAHLTSILSKEENDWILGKFYSAQQ